MFHDKGPCRIETSPLICSANQWNGFYLIGTSVMKELRRSSPIILRNSVLTSCNAQFTFPVFCFFSVWVLIYELSRFTGRQRKGVAVFLCLFYRFHSLYRHLEISRVIAAESSSLLIAGSRDRTGNFWFPNTSW